MNVMNRELSGEDLDVDPPCSSAVSTGGPAEHGSSVVEHGSSVVEHVVKGSVPDFIVKVKVEVDVDDSSPQDKEFDGKVKVNPENVDSPMEGEAHPVKKEKSPCSFLQTFMDALTNQRIKQELCDSLPREFGNAAQLQDNPVTDMSTPTTLEPKPVEDVEIFGLSSVSDYNSSTSNLSNGSKGKGQKRLLTMVSETDEESVLFKQWMTTAIERNIAKKEFLDIQRSKAILEVKKLKYDMGMRASHVE